MERILSSPVRMTSDASSSAPPQTMLFILSILVTVVIIACVVQICRTFQKGKLFVGFAGVVSLIINLFLRAVVGSAESIENADVLGLIGGIFMTIFQVCLVTTIINVIIFGCRKIKKYMPTDSSYPILSISKIALRIMGCIVALSAFIALQFNDFLDIILYEIGISEIGGLIKFVAGLISGAIAGFGFFVLAEIIELFVDMGKNIRSLAQSVRSLKEQKED
ncbi:MAG: hypothetical protein LBC86_08070 [Oscillospiraceae bacterium]|nr:hypothetical protein [Oscillospiraceae bacterium]